MTNIEIKEHWRFAYLSAIIRLKFLIWDFDFEEEVGEINYIGFPNPKKLVDIVDGFLADIPNLPQGDISRLLNIRERLVTKIAIAYDNGIQQATEVWSEAPRETISEYVKYDNDKIQSQAKLLLNSNWSLAEKSWFMESFCKTWQQELVNSFR